MILDVRDVNNITFMNRFYTDSMTESITDATNTSGSTDNRSDQKGLSTGVIVGIALGSAAVVSLYQIKLSLNNSNLTLINTDYLSFTIAIMSIQKEEKVPSTQKSR